MKKNRIFSTLLVLIAALLVAALTACGGAESATPTPEPTSTLTPTAVPPATPHPTIAPTVESAKDVSEALVAPSGYEPANIPDFYTKGSVGVAYLTSASNIFVLLLSSDEMGEQFIAELATYNTEAFRNEMAYLREQGGSEAAARWRPPDRFIPFLAWILPSQSEGGMMPTHIYVRTDEGALVYVGTDTVPVDLLSDTSYISNDVAEEIGNQFFKVFRKYVERAQEILEEAK